MTKVPAEVRFEKFIGPSNENDCISFLGAHDKGGYTRFWDGVRQTSGHAFFWKLAYGPVPEKCELDHTCRNPSCINPTHLEPVSHLENIMRGSLPGLTSARLRASINTKTHCVHGHALVSGNIYYRKTRGGQIGRRCRTCTLERQRKVNR